MEDQVKEEEYQDRREQGSYPPYLKGLRGICGKRVYSRSNKNGKEAKEKPKGKECTQYLGVSDHPQ